MIPKDSKDYQLYAKAAQHFLEFLQDPENEESLNYLVCDFVNDGIAYWAKLDLDHNQYEKARQALIDMGRKNICFEDVLTQILLDGESLTLLDKEDDEAPPEQLTLGALAYGAAFHYGMYNYYNPRDPESIKKIECLTRQELEEFFEDLDAEDADLIVQYALFDDIIFG